MSNKHKPSKHKSSSYKPPETENGAYRFAAMAGVKWVAPLYRKEEPTLSQMKAAMALSKAIEAMYPPTKK